MASWPYKTDYELMKAGYKFDKKGKCRGENCQAEIEWWTTPKLKAIPIDPGTMQPHWATCPDRESFRK